MALHVPTPVLEWPVPLASGARLALKMEALQPSGSFKLRGIGHACEVLAGRGARRFVSSSGGNAGLAVAYAGRALGVPVLVVVPESTLPGPRELIRRLGAEALVHGGSWTEANARALELLRADDAFLHPFDDPLVWRGHATLVEELPARPDAVVLSVGGGGLLCGVLEGLHARGWRDVPVVAAETVGADSFAQAVARGRPVELPSITSLATSLGARQVCERAFAWTREHPIESVVVRDAEAVAACLDFAREMRVLVEPACGAALAAAFGARSPALAQARRVLVVVCGGVGCTPEQLLEWSRSAI